MPATFLNISLVILTVACISGGQILFKYVSMLINEYQTIWNLKVWLIGILSLAVSGSGSLIYIGLLRSVTLNGTYPFMALSFAVVPLLSYMFYGERIQPSYFLGISLIIVGIAVVTRSV